MPVGAGVERRAPDQVENFLDNLAAALCVPANGTLIRAGNGSGCLGKVGLDNLSIPRMLVDPVDREWVQFLVNRLTPRGLASPVGRREFRSTQVLTMLGADLRPVDYLLLSALVFGSVN